MKALPLTVDGELGYLFEAAHHRDFITFVPEVTVSGDQADGLRFDQAAYLKSGWAAKNARFNLGETSKYTFPVLGHPLLDVHERRVTQFLQRLYHAYSVELVSN